MAEAAVIGGGATGLAAAALLAQDDWAVTVVDGRELPPPAPGPAPSARVLALTGASRAILERCGAWQHLDPARLAPWTRMEVWERDPDAGIAFTAEDADRAELGHIVEHEELVRALCRALAAAGAQLRCPDELTGLDADAAGAELELASGARLSARLAVGADGARSRTRELAGLDWEFRPHPQQAITAEVETGADFEPTAWQRFAPDGPAALLPLFSRHYSLVWSRARAAELMALDDDAFAAELAAAFGHRLGEMRLHGERLLLPLGRGFAPRWCAGSTALLGDAAHTVHPLAGLGQNLGLLDAAVLAEELARRPADVPRALRAYERRRKGPVRAMQCALEGFRTGFGADAPGAAALRGAGLGLAGRSRMARRFFIRRAELGLDAPAWLRAPGARSGRTSAGR